MSNVCSSSSVIGSPTGLRLRSHFILSKYVKSKFRLLADDTMIYLAIKSTDRCIQLQLEGLLNLEKWESDWKMGFNTSSVTFYASRESVIHMFMSITLKDKSSTYCILTNTGLVSTYNLTTSVGTNI